MTFVVVSHSLHHVTELCDRVVWIDGGKIVADGPTAEVVIAFAQSTGVPLEELELGDLAPAAEPVAS